MASRGGGEPKGYFNQHAYTCHVHYLSNLIWMCIWCVLICNHQHFVFLPMNSCPVPPKRDQGLGLEWVPSRKLSIPSRSNRHFAAVNCLIVCFCWWNFYWTCFDPPGAKGGLFSSEAPWFLAEWITNFQVESASFQNQESHVKTCGCLIWLSRNRIALNSFEVRIFSPMPGLFGCFAPNSSIDGSSWIGVNMWASCGDTRNN